MDASGKAVKSIMALRVMGVFAVVLRPENLSGIERSDGEGGGGGGGSYDIFFRMLFIYFFFIIWLFIFFFKY